jgi:1-deoxy-D-xylulose-5-phosphate synthase
MTSVHQMTATVPSPRQQPSLLCAELRGLDGVRLAALAAEIRAHLVDSVCAAGGHLGSNLGMVELTIALHRAFRSPWDPILFDIGHQAYVHKMLTGRWDRFRTLRQAGGLSGYPSRAESAHDFIENSHASTVISYADGVARAVELTGDPGRRVVAVIGDGALTGGMCWEAMNNLGASGRPVVLVLNDNERSYDPTLGSVAAHLATLRAGTADGNLFEQLGFDYLGPIDGHDFDALDDAFTVARSRQRPVLVHCVTVKGKGYVHAEGNDADRMHGIGVIDPSTGRGRGPAAVSWTNVFAEEIVDIARDRDDVVGVTAAMRLPVGFGPFAAEFPERVIDVGMAEQHAVTSAAGLAMGGLHPVVAVYATFLNRAFDQMLMDVALHNLPVTFVLDRAGVTGPDGPSHHGMWDLSLLAMAPGMRVACPRDTEALRVQLRQAVSSDGPTAIRFPKASAGAAIPACGTAGDVDLLAADGDEVLIVAIGQLAPMCLRAAEILRERGIGVTVADPGWVLPVSSSLVDLIAGFRVACVVEDGLGSGGVGDAVARAAAATEVPVRSIGLATQFLAHGTRNAVLAQAGLDAGQIADHVTTLVRPQS